MKNQSNHFFTTIATALILGLLLSFQIHSFQIRPVTVVASLGESEGNTGIAPLSNNPPINVETL